MAIENVGPGGVSRSGGPRSPETLQYKKDVAGIGNGKIYDEAGNQVGVGTVIPDFTSSVLTDNEYDAVLTPVDDSQTATINTGLIAGFGCLFNGMISFDGTATLVDKRTTVASNPNCAVFAFDTDSYVAVGSKL